MSKPTKAKAKSPFATAQASEDTLAKTLELPKEKFHQYTESRSRPISSPSWHSIGVKRTVSHADLGDRSEEDSEENDAMDEDSDSDQDAELLASYLEKVYSTQKSTTQLLLAMAQCLSILTPPSSSQNSTLQALLKTLTPEAEMAEKSS
jgi:hypothetical protein